MHCKRMMQGGRLAILGDGMSLAGVQCLRPNFSKQKYFDSGPRYFRIQLFGFLGFFYL